jgi:LemA protein
MYPGVLESVILSPMPLMIMLGVLGALLVLTIWSFNRLVSLRRLTENAWADVDVYLKRRAELVPNLVQAVKGASNYEQSTLERIVQARNSSLALNAPTPEKASAESELTTGLVRTIALAESYPALQANENFLKLQSELSDIERLIASSRQYYNACVRDYNTLIESFPSNLIAQTGGFKTKEFFEIDDLTERNAPTVAGLQEATSHAELAGDQVRSSLLDSDTQKLGGIAPESDETRLDSQS